MTYSLTFSKLFPYANPVDLFCAPFKVFPWHNLPVIRSALPQILVLPSCLTASMLKVHLCSIVYPSALPARPPCSVLTPRFNLHFTSPQIILIIRFLAEFLMFVSIVSPKHHYNIEGSPVKKSSSSLYVLITRILYGTVLKCMKVVMILSVVQ